MSVLGLINAQLYRPGGNSTALNITAATGAGAVGIKNPAATGVVMRIIPNTLGTTNPLTLNDLAVNTGAAAANQVISIPVASMVAGVPITIEAVFQNGLVISSFPTGGSYVITYS